LEFGHLHYLASFVVHRGLDQGDGVGGGRVILERLGGRKHVPAASAHLGQQAAHVAGHFVGFAEGIRD